MHKAKPSSLWESGAMPTRKNHSKILQTWSVSFSAFSLRFDQQQSALHTSVHIKQLNKTGFNMHAFSFAF